ncbi:hypothetical protein L861_18955 [Litchfieldella anticariensis FP35 = DSM 16096]|uniref:Uncharacterized protein n=1 Tax=Litchfieldella anticariensis (strain DSM 16096 / CECT 5854 / CIP 108499 / LMG 22089 / FP35) TaxID=1121939 RepID=S2KNX6_LITA3|nr:hypothetical protein [Halomonas anticariensis]EPC03615.1 hypothetical protein L861_18955 [Halomonas anticariensis FP35 = DSM 16096]
MNLKALGLSVAVVALASVGAVVYYHEREAQAPVVAAEIEDEMLVAVTTQGGLVSGEIEAIHAGTSMKGETAMAQEGQHGNALYGTSIEGNAEVVPGSDIEEVSAKVAEATK